MAARSPGALDDRPARGAQADAHLAGDQVRERGLAEARGTGEQDVIERLAALARRADEDLAGSP